MSLSYFRQPPSNRKSSRRTTAVSHNSLFPPMSIRTCGSLARADNFSRLFLSYISSLQKTSTTMDLFRKQRSSPADLDDDGATGRPRSRTMDTASLLPTPRAISSTREMDIGRPMNFKHNVNVRMESDGTFSGMPDEWLTILLKQASFNIPLSRDKVHFLQPFLFSGCVRSRTRRPRGR